MTVHAQPFEILMADGVVLRGQRWGEGADWIILLHEPGEDRDLDDWRLLLPAIMAPERTLLTVDLRGHGDSDYPATGYDVGTLTEDVRQFLDALNLDQVILVGHSMANVELCHLTALYPERVHKLVFLDAAYDRTKFKAVWEEDPRRAIPPPQADLFMVEAYITNLKRVRPDLAEIWSEVWEEEVRHSVMKDAAGKIVDKMSNNIEQALIETILGYSPELARIHVPVLSIYAIREEEPLPDYFTSKQRGVVREFVAKRWLPVQTECIEQFQRAVPHAKIVKIPKGHHFCFMQQEVLVFTEMRTFLRES